MTPTCGSASSPSWAKKLDVQTWERASLPLHMGGLGLRSACRSAPAAHWGSWVDCLHTISNRHAQLSSPSFSAVHLRGATMSRASPSFSAVHLRGATMSRASLAGDGFVCPEWTSLVEGLRRQQPALGEVDPGQPTHGWQFFAAQAAEKHFRSATLWPRLSPAEEAHMKSQSGPMSGVPFSVVPSSAPTHLAPQLFRVLLLRRLAPPFRSSLWKALPPWSAGKQAPGCQRISL